VCRRLYLFVPGDAFRLTANGYSRRRDGQCYGRYTNSEGGLDHPQRAGPAHGGVSFRRIRRRPVWRIDPIGENIESFVEVYRRPHIEKIHVVELWRIIEGGEMMEASFSVDDLDALYEPRT
jgi:hypothetical protein